MARGMIDRLLELNLICFKPFGRVGGSDAGTFLGLEAEVDTDVLLEVFVLVGTAAAAAVSPNEFDPTFKFCKFDRRCMELRVPAINLFPSKFRIFSF